MQLSSSFFKDYQQDICEIFERADCPNIFARKTKGQINLQSLEVSETTPQQSIKSMQGIIDAIVYLKLLLMKPCQIKFSYVIKVKGVWGLSHIICQGNRVQEKDITQNNNSQKVIKFDEDSQLMWSLGKIWLRFFSQQIYFDGQVSQEQIDQFIDNKIKYVPIRSTIKKLLCVSQKKRISFEDFVSEDILLREQNFNSLCYSSLIHHMQGMSKINIDNKMMKFESNMPFVRQIKYRDFKEYTEIDLFLQNFKNEIKKELSKSVSEESMEFLQYMLSLQNYMNMIRINKDKLNIGDRFQQIEDRKFYAKFTQRMVNIKELLNRKRKIIKHGGKVSSSLFVFLQDPDTIDSKKVYNQFKETIKQFMNILQTDLKKDKKNFFKLRLFTKFFLARTCIYVFSDYRSQVFEPFLHHNEKFNLRKVIKQISGCEDSNKLSMLVKNIHNFYFQ